MQVRHNATGQTQSLSKADWKVLSDRGYAANFTVLQEEDYQPEELSLPPVGDKKPKTEKADK